MTCAHVEAGRSISIAVGNKYNSRQGKYQLPEHFLIHIAKVLTYCIEKAKKELKMQSNTICSSRIDYSNLPQFFICRF